MINIPEIIYLIGFPACGKSTFCNSLIKSHKIISTDNIIDEHSAKWNLKYFQTIMTIKEDVVNTRIVADLKSAVANNQDIIVDRTNLSYHARICTMRYITDRYKRIGVVFNVQQDILKFRLKRRECLTDKYIPEEVIDKMYKNFQFPYGREFHEIKMIYS